MLSFIWPGQPLDAQRGQACTCAGSAPRLRRPRQDWRARVRLSGWRRMARSTSSALSWGVKQTFSQLVERISRSPCNYSGYSVRSRARSGHSLTDSQSSDFLENFSASALSRYRSGPGAAIAPTREPSAIHLWMPPIGQRRNKNCSPAGPEHRYPHVDATASLKRV